MKKIIMLLSALITTQVHAELPGVTKNPVIIHCGSSITCKGGQCSMNGEDAWYFSSKAPSAKDGSYRLMVAEIGGGAQQFGVCLYNDRTLGVVPLYSFGHRVTPTGQGWNEYSCYPDGGYYCSMLVQ